MQSPVALKCPNCGSILRAAGLDLQSGIATCDYCQALSAVSIPSPSNGLIERPPVAMPSCMTCEMEGPDFVITRRWFSHAAWVLLVVSIVWSAMVFFWYDHALSSTASLPEKIIPILHLVAGAALIYSVLGMFLNKTVIRVGGGQLSIRHGPVPWTGNATLDLSSIRQFYCKEITREANNGNGAFYLLLAGLHDGTARKLMSTVMDGDQVLFVEQRLENALGIRDMAVAGEMPR